VTKGKIRKGAIVTYSTPRHGEYQAIVRCRHMDGTATIEARFQIENGKAVGGFLGKDFRYRIPVSALEVQP